MEIHHKAHAPQSWRELVKEVAIIGLGVLIALGAEQAVEALHWRHKVEVVRASLMGELANDRGRWEANRASARCALSVIYRYDHWAKAGGPAPAGKDLEAQAGMFWMHSANWSLAVGSQALDHMPIDEQLKFASLYDGIVHREVTIEQSAAALDRALSLLALADDAEGRRALRGALSDLKTKLVSMLGDDDYMTRHFDALHVRPDRRDFAADVQGCSTG